VWGARSRHLAVRGKAFAIAIVENSRLGCVLATATASWSAGWPGSDDYYTFDYEGIQITK
jgi:hypothetical protein